MPDITIVTYELYTLEHAGWVLHSRYPSSDRAEAVADAKNIEVTLEQATKLVRETYTPDTNHYDEAVVRISPDLVEFKKKLRKHKRAVARSGGGMSDDPFAAYAPDAENKPQLKPRQVITGVTMMTLSALVIAAGVTAIASLLLRTQFSEQYISIKDIPPVLFGIFLAVFLLAALPLISRYIPNFSRKETALPDDFFIDMKDAAPTPELRDHPNSEPQQDAGAPPALFKNDPGLMAEPELNASEPEKDAAPVSEPTPKPKAETPTKKNKTEEASRAKKENVEISDKEEEEETDTSSAPDKQRMSMMRFLTGVITALKDVCPQLDTYNKFGLNLIMAGACTNLGLQTSLTETQTKDLIQEAITMLGGRDALAADFCRKLDGYMAEPRYAEMYRIGLTAYGDFADQHNSAFDAIVEAMGLWNKPSDRITGAKILTIMFTDIVSSTLITYKRGDNEAQTLIRRHNTIVRQALAQFHGEEIKHTGDGIMACFQTPSSAIEAAVAIQRAVQSHNAAIPEEEFQLRIGLNTGEPIREDNDLFGSSVQLASRTCNTAGPGQIFISNVVQELVADQGYPIETQPPRKLKGIKEAQIFHNVLWTDFAAASDIVINSEMTADTIDSSKDQNTAKTIAEPPTVDASPAASQKKAATNTLTSDQVLNAAQQIAQHSTEKTEDATKFVKKIH